MEKLLLPKFGQTMEEGSIVEWFVGEGDTFDVGDDLYVIETEKSNITVEATIAGRLHRVLQTAGSTVSVGTVVGVVLGEDEQPSSDELAAYLGETADVAESPTDEGESPSDGRSAAVGGPAVAKRSRLEGVQRHAARVVTESWQEIPHFQQVVLADATNLLIARAALIAESADSGVRVSLNDVILDRIVSAVAEVPTVNASYQDGDVIQYADVDVAVAVATDRGLVTPVLRRSNDMSLVERAKALRELARRSADATLKPADLENPTITVSNLGMHGVDTGFALVTRPQGAIVFIGQVSERPMVVDGVVVARQSVYLSVSYDHRVVDGAAAAAFLSALRRSVERPAP